MPQLDSDNFAYSDGALATVSSGKWSDAIGAVAVLSGQIHNGGNENAAFITSWPGSLIAQYSEVKFVSGAYGGPTIFNNGTGSFYIAELEQGNAVYLVKVTAGSFASLANGGTTTAGHTYRIRVETIGTIVISDNGTDIITFADSTFTTGKPGLRCWSNYLDDWAAGDFSAGDVTVNPTGVSATGSVGTVAVSAGATISPTGVSATAGLGSVVVAGGASVAVTGEAATTGLGTVTVTAAATVAPTGVDATGQLGTVAVSLSLNVLPLGVEATGDVGTLTVQSSGIVALAGVSAIGRVGTVVVVSDITWGFQRMKLSNSDRMTNKRIEMNNE